MRAAGASQSRGHRLRRLTRTLRFAARLLPRILAGKAREKGQIMGRSSLLGSEHAALEPARRDADALGPGDSSDSGSDRVGLDDESSSDVVGRAGERVARARISQHRTPVPGPNPAPDKPDNPGLPGEGDDDELPGDSEQDHDDHRPGRATGAKAPAPRRREGS